MVLFRARPLLNTICRIGKRQADTGAPHAELSRHFENLVVVELGHLLGGLKRPLAFDVRSRWRPDVSG